MIYKNKIFLSAILLSSGLTFCMDFSSELVTDNDGFAKLPREIQNGILECLSVKDIKNLRLMNKRLKEASKEIFKRQKEVGDKLGLELVNTLSLKFYNKNLDKLANKMINSEDVNFNKCNEDGQSALIICCIKMFERAHFISKLIESGAKIDLQDKLGCTALMHISRWAFFTETTKLLIDAKANLDLLDKNGQTVLIRACKNACYLKGHIEVIKLLVKSGSNLNIQDTDGQTALMTVCEYAFAGPEFIDLIEFLIKSGSNVNLKNKNCQTALDIIQDLKAKNLVQKIINKFEKK